MPAMLSRMRKQTEVVELIMVTIYVVLTAYIFTCSAPPRMAFALRDVATPFQVIVRARNAGAERNLAVWQSSKLENRALASATSGLAGAAAQLVHFRARRHAKCEEPYESALRMPLTSMPNCAHFL